MHMKTVLITIATIVGIAIIGMVILYVSESSVVKNIATFSQCEENGYPVQESQPRRCVTPDGRTFTEDAVTPTPNLNLGENPNPGQNPTATSTGSHPLISVQSLKAGDTVRGPLTITGQARGYWFFEASFPVELLDANGTQIAISPAQAQGEWMTENFVPFSVTLTFTNPQTQNGTLVLRKDNPSGLPELDDELRIPVVIGAN